MLQNLLLWLKSCHDAFKLLRVTQDTRNIIYQDTGRYPEMRLKIDHVTVLYWPEGQKYPRKPEAHEQ